ncbi:hypothetical protein ED92_07930 [Amycolatopsis sp. MJM2582]|nr:hypothetical protein ED92_07930 [Amycolatopsis sp. MJM2582]
MPKVSPTSAFTSTCSLLTETVPASPASSRSAGLAASWTLPKWSTVSTSATSLPGNTATNGSGSRTRSSTRGPNSSGGTPSARCAAAEANTSRPWNVDDVTGRRYPGAASSYAAITPVSVSAAGMRSPLSGPTSIPRSVTTTTPRRAVPTPGSTTARWTDSGRYGAVWASTSAPVLTCCGGISWLTSITRTDGAIRAITPWHAATKPSLSP